MSIDAQTTDKYEAFLELLEQGLTMLHMDARAIGVDVPRQYQDDAHLRLQTRRASNLRGAPERHRHRHVPRARASAREIKDLRRVR